MQPQTQSLTAQQALDQLQYSGVPVILPEAMGSSKSSDEDLRDLFSTRAVLEEQAARLAAQHLTPSDIETLEAIATSLEDAVRERRLDALAGLHRELHFTIYRATKRRHLLRVIGDLWDASAHRAGSASHMVSEDPAEDLFAVRALVAACRLKDANGLGLMVRHKIHQTATQLLEHGIVADGDVPESGTVLLEDSARKRAK